MKTHSNSIYQPIVLFIGAKLLSTGNRLFIGLFGTLMLPLLILASGIYISAFIFGTPCDVMYILSNRHPHFIGFSWLDKNLNVYENLLLVHFFMGIILLQEVLYLAQMQ